MKPDYQELMLMLYHYLVKRGIKQSVVVNCDGCRYDSPGQRAHMGFGGCLQEWDDIVDLYLPGALLDLDAPTLQDKFCRALDGLEWPQPQQQVIRDAAETLLQQNSNPTKLEWILKGPDNTPADYLQVFRDL